MRRRHRSLGALSACALAALLAVAVAGAESTTSYRDPIGDATSTLDITGLDVSEYEAQDAWGLPPSFRFFVDLAPNKLSCRGEGGDLPVLVAIDTDQNPDTGSAFYGTEVELAFEPPSNARDGEPHLLRADGWDFRAAPLPEGFGWECGPVGGGYDVAASALGIRPGSGFNVVAATIGSSDTAPDIGTFNYQPVPGTPAPPLGPDRRAPHLINYGSRAVPGRLARLTYWVLDGRGHTAETIRIYRKTRLLKTIRRPLRRSNPFKLSHVNWLVPRSVHGHLRVSVRAVDAAGNRSRLSWATLTVR